MDKRKIGREKEKSAVLYLIKDGYKILETNFFTSFGEIDIIAEKNSEIIFVEVKYRSSLKYGYPVEAVDSRKQKKIYDSALYYIYLKKLSSDINFRFDVISIIGSEIEHYKNAFGGQ